MEKGDKGRRFMHKNEDAVRFEFRLHTDFRNLGSTAESLPLSSKRIDSIVEWFLGEEDCSGFIYAGFYLLVGADTLPRNAPSTDVSFEWFSKMCELMDGRSGGIIEAANLEYVRLDLNQNEVEISHQNYQSDQFNFWKTVDRQELIRTFAIEAKHYLDLLEVLEARGLEKLNGLNWANKDITQQYYSMLHRLKIADARLACEKMSGLIEG